MATNPLIAASGSNIVPTFSNVLTNVGNIQQQEIIAEQAPERQKLLESQAEIASKQVPSELQEFTEQDRAFASSVADVSRRIIPDLESGNVNAAIAKLQNRSTRMKASGVDTTNTDKAIELAKTNPAELLRASKNAVAVDERVNVKKTAFQFGGQETLKDEEGNLFLATGKRNPATGTVETAVSPIGGGTAQPVGKLSLVSATGETAKERIETKKKESRIAIEQARGTERAKLIEKRGSDITKELSQRNRDASRSMQTLNKALTLAQQSSQGLTGSSKLQLSRLLPGIDASNEAALDASLKQLALEQLQQFKGPTTDFEFGVTQAIAGSIGQSQSANIARVKSLKRAAWFNKREFDQFESHKKAGGNPDAFRFNFGESVKTKKGVFTLQDIQDTAVQRNMTIEETIKRLNQ